MATGPGAESDAGAPVADDDRPNGGGLVFIGGSGMVPLERAGSPGRAGSGVETRLNMEVPPKTLN
jgi:hypothetical protein